MPVDAAGPPGPPDRPTARADPLLGAAVGGVYADPRPREAVEDPGFALAVGLLGAVFTQLGASLPSRAGMELSWALAELEDYGELAPAVPITPDLGGHEVGAVVADLERYLKVLASTSPDLATTLRYLRTHEHLHAALTTLITPSEPNNPDNPGDPHGD